ncbi:hypothetical protein NLU13_0217 [Sarocladium strictum]|uniref:Uncharacterized protein n=1 Tax=Sarocladium strictum TaxID=5046 RepID=A0AA39GQJ6_SARSR|nr:hypothetical protein NLU13_0217 [Sarocladium strictum]
MSKQCCSARLTTTAWSTDSPASPLSSYLARQRPWADANVVLILTSANALRGCAACRVALHDHYGIPSFWWSEYCHNANGYFGSVATPSPNVPGALMSHTSWAKFRVKMVHEADHYAWYKINVFVHWRPTQTTVILFDTPPSLSSQIPDVVFEELPYSELSDPFWVYGYLVAEVVRIQDKMIWSFRTKIRNIEMGRESRGAPQPDFGRLHDLARHSVHFLETFGLATKAISDILREHAVLGLSTQSTGPRFPPAPGVQDKLRFFANMLENLQHRASSNHERLHNEIQLTFNLVTQYDAKVSLSLSSAMKTDGAATKALTLLAAAFLPATFICAVFSMSFFSYSEAGWVMSKQIWIYFAFAIPFTLLTIGIWQFGSAKMLR